MLEALITSSPIVLKLRMSDHGALLVPQADMCRAVLKAGKDTCHECGMRVPGAMEIDHLKGHRPCNEADLAPICQFCHNLKHPIWAGARKRFIPIFAPDMSQADLHRLAWTCLAWRSDEEVSAGIGAVLDAIAARHKLFVDTYKTDNVSSFFESITGLPDLIGQDSALKLARQTDSFVRFWPSEVLPDFETFEASRRLTTWSVGGFKICSDMAARALRDYVKPDLTALQQGASKFC